MNGESRRMHQRAAVVAIIGILLGTLSRASLVDSAMRPQPPRLSNPGLLVVRRIPAHDARVYTTRRFREPLVADAAAALN
jgi:hypothetical protein